MSISTRRGDDGGTELMFGRRVAKNHPRIIAGGAVDELNAALGLARAADSENSGSENSVGEFIAAVQEDLVVLMGDIATLPEDLPRYKAAGFEVFCVERAHKLDARVASIEEQEITFKGWVFPGASSDMFAAHLDHARTVCRRAERELLMLQDAVNGAILIYLNRLSDVLWLLAREREGQA
jgi:cob(I)alamin adenosyltransferase